MALLTLLVLVGIYFSSVVSSAFNMQVEGPNGPAPNVSPGLGLGMGISYFALAVIWFFPFMFLFRFSSQMRYALAANDQERLNTSFQNLKICFRYVGIVTMIVLVLYILLFVIGIMSATTL
jgi:hypothetical protein